MDGIFHLADDVLVLGDFNLWIELSNRKDCKEVLQAMSMYGLSQLVTSPTHIAGHTIDHVYANVTSCPPKVRVLSEQFEISPDHYPILITMPIQPMLNLKYGKHTVTYRKLKNISHEQFSYDLHAVLQEIDTSMSFTECYNAIKYHIQLLLNRHAPIQNI